MPDDASSPNAPLDDFQSYLLLLARTQLDAVAGPPIDPQDAVQQTLAKAHENFAQFRGTSDHELAGWLRRILANHLTDLFRRRGRELDEQALAGHLEQSSCRLSELLLAEQSSPSHRLKNAERLLRLADALRDVPEEQRRAIELRHLKGLTLAEISATMGRSMSSVGGLLQRGLKTLRENMKEGDA